MPVSNVLNDRTSRRLDADRLMSAMHNLGDPAAHPSVPFTPRPHTDVAFFAPCLETRSEPHNRKLTDEQAHEIRVHYATGKASQRRLAKLYGVSQNVIYHIVTGNHYREASAS